MVGRSCVWPIEARSPPQGRDPGEQAQGYRRDDGPRDGAVKRMTSPCWRTKQSCLLWFPSWPADLAHRSCLSAPPGEGRPGYRQDHEC